MVYLRIPLVFTFSIIPGRKLVELEFESIESVEFTCARVKSRYIGDGHPTVNRNPPTIGLITIPYYMEMMGV